MSSYINDNLRKQVEERAKSLCEYCLIPIEETYFGGEIDHIESLKHDGPTILENLALACQPCNRNKGSDLGSNSATTNILARFYNPRIDLWSEHFRVNEDADIISLTEIGEVTVRIFKFNDFERVLERQGLIELGLWNIK
jgi:HNH endonuclease